ncbi:MAG: hypothetical protein LBH54_00800, partial [Clostridiales bacterium]|nr:hypothetical protein [Clostridiales bacterium]
MNWYVCLTVSLLFIVLSAIAVIIKKLKNNHKYAVACLSLLCAGYIIYLPYFNSRYSVANALIANLFHLMQIVSLDADFFSVNEVCFSQVNNIVFAEIYSFAVAVIHIALPLLLLLSAINLLRFFLTEFSAWHICRKNNNFYVFSQFNEKSRLLAEDMKRNLKANGNFIIAASEKDAENA